MKDQFWEAANKLPLSAPSPFESTDKYDHHHYLMLFDDHPKGDDILISSWSILGMIAEKASCYRRLRFESNTQSNQLFET